MKVKKGDLWMTKQGMGIQIRKIIKEGIDKGRMEINVPSDKGWRKFGFPIHKKALLHKIM